MQSETNYNNENEYNGETVANNAILRARQYAVDVFGSNVGAVGRLLTYDEANTSETNSLVGTGKVSTTVLYGIWEDASEKVGGSSGNGYLYYWLASSSENYNNFVDVIVGEYTSLGWWLYSEQNWCGVRPVIEVPESAIQ